MKKLIQNIILLLISITIFEKANAQDCNAAFDYQIVDDISSYTYRFTDRSSTSAAIAFYYWDFGDGSSSKLINPEHQFLSEGIFIVSLSIKTVDSCESIFYDTINVETVIPPNCMAYFTFIQVPQSVNYTYAFTDHSVSGTGDTINSYFWTFGDGQVSIFQNPIHQYQTTGNFTVNLTIATKLGCISDYSFQISISPGPLACQASFTSNADSLTNPLKYYFHDNSIHSTNIISWKWHFDDGDSSNMQDPTHIFPFAGLYFVKLEITTQGGCSSDVTYPISVGNSQPYNLWGRVYAGPYVIDKCIAYLYKEFNNNHFKPIDTVRLTSVNDTLGVYYFFQIPEGNHRVKVLLPGNSIFSDNYAPTYFGDDVKWNFGSTINLFQDIALANVSLEETTKSLGNCQIKGQVLLNSNILPNVENIELLLFNSQNQLVDYTFTNSFGDFQFDDIIPGSYYVSGEVTGLLADMVAIQLIGNQDTVSNLVLTLNNKTITGFFKQQIVSDFKFNLYPNPAADYLNINVTGKNSFNSIKVEIFDLQGRVLLSEKSSIKQLSMINISNLTKGVYFLRITDITTQQSTLAQFIKN